MKILITGGCGFIGSSLAIFLKEKIKTAQITSIDNLSRKGSTLNKNRIIENKIEIIAININGVAEIIGESNANFFALLRNAFSYSAVC